MFDMNFNGFEQTQAGADFFASLPRRRTAGEILADDTILDVATTPARDGLKLIQFSGNAYSIQPQILHSGSLYLPPDLDRSVLEAVRFPSEVTDYASRECLLFELETNFPPRFFCDEDSAFWALIAIASWLPELFPVPLTVIIHSTDENRVIALFEVLHCMLRRPLMLAELRRHLPFDLHPTILLSQQAMTRNQRATWRSANFRSLQLPRGRGLIRTGVMKIIYEQDPKNASEWNPDAIHFNLLPGESQFLPARARQQMADYLQPRLQFYRFEHLQEFLNKQKKQNLYQQYRKVETRFAPLLALAGNFGAESIFKPRLESQEWELQELRDRDPDVAILRAIWAAAHDARDMTIEDVTSRVNALLSSQGERELNSREIGWHFRKLGLPRRRTANCKLLRFSVELQRHVHRLTSSFDLELPVYEDCESCKPPTHPSTKDVEAAAAIE